MSGWPKKTSVATVGKVKNRLKPKRTRIAQHLAMIIELFLAGRPRIISKVPLFFSWEREPIVSKETKKIKVKGKLEKKERIVAWPDKKKLLK